MLWADWESKIRRGSIDLVVNQSLSLGLFDSVLTLSFQELTVIGLGASKKWILLKERKNMVQSEILKHANLSLQKCKLVHCGQGVGLQIRYQSSL